MLGGRTKMKNYEKYLDGILLITGSHRTEAIHLYLSSTYLFSFVVLLAFEVGWSPSSPSPCYSPIQGFVFSIAGISFEGVGVGGCFLAFVCFFF